MDQASALRGNWLARSPGPARPLVGKRQEAVDQPVLLTIGRVAEH